MEPLASPAPAPVPPKPKRKHRRVRPLTPPPEDEPLEAPEPQEPQAPPEPEFEAHRAPGGTEFFQLPRGFDEPPPPDEPMGDPSDHGPSMGEGLFETTELPQFVAGRVDPEVERRRRDALARIRRYKQHFEALRSVPVSEHATAEELEAILANFRLVVGSKSTFGLVKGGYLAAVKTLEMAGGMFGLKVYGTSDLLGKSPQVETLLKQIVSEYGVGENLSPVQSLGFVTVASLVQVDCMNRRAEALQSFMKSPVEPQVLERFADL